MLSRTVDLVPDLFAHRFLCSSFIYLFLILVVTGKMRQTNAWFPALRIRSSVSASVIVSALPLRSAVCVRCAEQTRKILNVSNLKRRTDM